MCGNPVPWVRIPPSPPFCGSDANHGRASRGAPSTPAALRSLRRSLRLRLGHAPCRCGAAPRAARPWLSSEPLPFDWRSVLIVGNLVNNRVLKSGWRPGAGRTERCRSGRTGRSRKPLTVQAVRGFESHPLRHSRLGARMASRLVFGGPTSDGVRARTERIPGAPPLGANPSRRRCGHIRQPPSTLRSRALPAALQRTLRHRGRHHEHPQDRPAVGFRPGGQRALTLGE